MNLKYTLDHAPCMLDDCKHYKTKELKPVCLACSHFARRNNYEEQKKDKKMPRYMDNEDGTISDIKSCLMWQEADDGILRNFKDAKKYAENLTLAGYNDWRVPTIEELSTIVDFKRCDPAISPAFDCQSGKYWSSSSYADDSSYAWYVGFYSGGTGWACKTNSLFVRCVRGI